METIIIIALLVIVAVSVFFLFRRLNQLEKPKDEQSMLLLQQQMGQLTDALDRKLSEANRLTQSQLLESGKFISGVSKDSREMLSQISEQSQRMIKEVTEKLTKLDETNRQVVDFSAQLKNLQDILKNPKQRGILGEYYLEETLKNVLPPNSYQMQYKFKKDEAGKEEIVDAVIFVKDRIIPVDSKFSLENYEKLIVCNDAAQREILEKQFKQDLKNRIDETAKYVRPAENTVDFAFMFIPSESIYYDLLVNKVGLANVSSRDLIEYAFREKHVIIVSPTSFLAYLQTVLQGLNMLKLEEYTKQIQKNVEKLGKHLQGYEAYHDKVGSSLSTVVSHFNKSHKELKKIDKDVMKITDVEELMKLEGGEIDKPVTDE